MKTRTVALIGNPNVGKSTIFNALTGLHQHTGNWSGKTVSNMRGIWQYEEEKMVIYDLPGTVSLTPHSLEEEVARDFICFSDYDVAVVVIDGLLLERGLQLVLQVLEVHPNTVLCINFMDILEKKKMVLDLEKLSMLLHIPVVGVTAREGKGMNDLCKAIFSAQNDQPYFISYPNYIEECISVISKNLPEGDYPSRWVSLKLMEGDFLFSHLPNLNKSSLSHVLEIPRRVYQGEVVLSAIHNEAKYLSVQVCHYPKEERRNFSWDRFITSKKTGIPFMLLLLFLILFLTIRLSNIPSSWLFQFFHWTEEKMMSFFLSLSLPNWFCNLFVCGMYRTLTWVVSVMFPPMAIFFPLFTILEDYGILPRIAFNLDRPFEKCHACGKQALTMCMGLGCNAVGVMGARIIDSKRERMIAILTNSFLPCNGRFPTLIAMISMFLVGVNHSLWGSVFSSLWLTFFIVLGVFATFVCSYLLSKTVLRGYPSSFVLEIPAYRKPQFGKVLLYSIWNRGLFVLGRAVFISAPAGIVIWLLSNVQIQGVTILAILRDFLNPIGVFFGLDGMILLAFLLGFPANEIVMPILLLGYLSLGGLVEIPDFVMMKSILLQQGWSFWTALSFLFLCVFHFPCSTTILTIKKETHSWKWATFAFLFPTMIGLFCCLVIRFLSFLF